MIVKELGGEHPIKCTEMTGLIPTQRDGFFVLSLHEIASIYMPTPVLVYALTEVPPLCINLVQCTFHSWKEIATTYRKFTVPNIAANPLVGTSNMHPKTLKW